MRVEYNEANYVPYLSTCIQHCRAKGKVHLKLRAVRSKHKNDLKRVTKYAAVFRFFQTIAKLDAFNVMKDQFGYILIETA